MARNWFINGETMVFVKGRADSGIGTLQELGLAADQIVITPTYYHKPINVDAWGGANGPPAEVQVFLASVTVRMALIHLDRSILDICEALSLGAGVVNPGVLPRAGALLGNNVARFAAGNNYVGLNLSSPVGNKPWRFYFAYLTGPPFSFPLGTEKSIVQLNWEVIPYTRDPYNSGSGASGQVLWDHTLDN